MGFITHDLNGKTRGAIVLVVRGVCVVIVKVEVGWEVGGALGAKSEKGLLVKVGAKVLCWFEEIAALDVVTGNVNVGNLPTIIVGQVQRG